MRFFFVYFLFLFTPSSCRALLFYPQKISLCNPKQAVPAAIMTLSIEDLTALLRNRWREKKAKLKKLDSELERPSLNSSTKHEVRLFQTKKILHF